MRKSPTKRYKLRSALRPYDNDICPFFLKKSLIHGFQGRCDSNFICRSGSNSYFHSNKRPYDEISHIFHKLAFDANGEPSSSSYGLSQITAVDTQAPGRNKPTVPFVSGIAYNALQQPTVWNWTHCGNSPVAGTGRSPSATSCVNATCAYDSAGRMTANELASYQFDTASRITGISQNLWASLVTTSTFSSTASGTVTNTVTSNTSYYQTPISWSIGYDARSRVTSFNRVLANSGAVGANGTNGNSSTAYSYDANSNRLTSINKKIADSDLDGDFDQADRAQTIAQDLNVEGASNKLLGFSQITTTTRGTRTLSTVNTQVNYALDAVGNLTSDGLRQFNYDANNRHVQTSVGFGAESSKITYLHNALGQRVFKSEPQIDQTAPNEATLGTPFVDWLKKSFGWLFAAGQANATLGQTYLYADGQLPDYAMLGEYGNGAASGAGRTEYIYLPTDSGAAIPIGIFRSNRLFAVHTDPLSTPRQITDDTNKTVWQWPYSAFGDNKPTGILKATANPNNAYTQDPTTNARLQATNPALAYNPRFAGQYFDIESNLNQNFNRSYAPNVGAYTQMDPIGLGGGVNRRGYVGGNPLSFNDSSGLCPWCVPAAAAAGACYAGKKIYDSINDLLDGAKNLQNAGSAGQDYQNIQNAMNQWYANGMRGDPPYTQRQLQSAAQSVVGTAGNVAESATKIPGTSVTGPVVAPPGPLIPNLHPRKH